MNVTQEHSPPGFGVLAPHQGTLLMRVMLYYHHHWKGCLNLLGFAAGDVSFWERRWLDPPHTAKLAQSWRKAIKGCL